jgi:hypothetical protein
MDSHYCKGIVSIDTHFYSIPPIPGALRLVPTCPDAEIAPQNLLMAQSPTLYFSRRVTTLHYTQNNLEEGIYTSLTH